MVDLLIETLEQLNLPVRRQGSLAGQEYPNSFFTFWNTESENGSFYNNKEHKTEHMFTICFYSTDISETYSKLEEAIDILKNAGFKCKGKGYDTDSDEITHYGRAVDVIYIETIKQVKQDKGE